MKAKLLIVLLLLTALGSLRAAPATCTDCGIVPVKPVPPVGCKDLYARCVCDENADNCRWEWVCVPIR